MQKIFNADILDLITSDYDLIYAARETLGNGKEAVSFHLFDPVEDSFERIPVNQYISCKFGSDGFDAARNLVDFITCSLATLPDGRIAASYPDGRLKILSDSFMPVDERKIEYMGHPAKSIIAKGNDLWFCVPDGNAVINYSLKYNRIEFRIGSSKDKTFSHPTDLSYYDDMLYVCTANSYKIRTLDLNDFSVRDYKLFHEPVYKYFRIGEKEYVYLRTGVYSL